MADVRVMVYREDWRRRERESKEGEREEAKGD